jgi:NhaC family Na+:H+ antiporter
MSPLSETTNLAPAVAGTDLYTHIKGMLWTTIPSIVIALIIFAVIGYNGDVTDALDLTAVLDAISSVFNVGLLPLLPLFVVLILSFRRVSAFATIFLGALIGGVMAVLLQPDVVLTFGSAPGLNTPLAMLKGVWSAMATGFIINRIFKRCANNNHITIYRHGTSERII